MMSDALILLLKIFAGTLVLNIFISVLQLKEPGSRAVHRVPLYLWLFLLAEFVVQGLHQEVDLLNISFFFLSFAPTMLLAHFAELTMGIPVPRKAILVFTAVCWATTLVLHSIGLGFRYYAFPVAVAIAAPLFVMVAKAVGTDVRKKLSFVQKFYLVTAFVMAAHYLDYPILREDSSTTMFGAALLYAIVHTYSILIPMLVNEAAYREYNARLEADVSNKTQMLLVSSKMAALGEMAGGIAHEINTPLAVVKTLSEMLTEVAETEPVDSGAIRQLTPKITKTADRIAKIVQGLRLFAKESDASEPLESVNAKKLIDDTLDLCRERIKDRGIELIIEDFSAEISLKGRPSELSQVLLNLLNNAVDAIAESSRKWIRLSVLEKDTRVEIAVTDSGQGIPASLRTQIFQPFFTTKDVGKGTGLGLSVSKGIAEAQGGSLELDETASNTRFRLSLARA